MSSLTEHDLRRFRAGDEAIFRRLVHVLAGVTTFFAVALSTGGGGTSPVTLGVPVILVSVGAATATVWWSQVHGAAAARSR